MASSLADLPAGLREALFAGIFASIRPMLPHALAERLEQRAQGPASDFPELGAPDIQWFDVALSQRNGFLVHLKLACDRAQVTGALPDPGAAATPAQTMLSGQITVAADTTLGSIQLLRRELSSLEAGAVVVLEEEAGSAFTVRTEDALYRFVPTDTAWRSSGPLPVNRFHPRTTVHWKGEPSMDEHQNLPEATEGEVSLDDLRINIDFDLGRSMVPLSVVGQWQPGALIDLTPPQVGEGLAVTIRANGDVVGTGDVVRIDDRLAVRITRFTLRS